jgi:sugar phosphate isomerase/epimerase
MAVDRRTFLTSSLAALVAACARPRALGQVSPPRLPLSFSTLGCPTWDWQRVVDFAGAHRFAGVELRGIQQTIDLPTLPQFQPDRIEATKRDLAVRELVVPCLGSSTNLHEMDETKHAAELDHARRFIDLAQALGAPYVRVFGNKYVPGVAREATIAHIAAGLRTLGEYARPRNVVVVLESHGDFTDSPTLLELMQRADSPAVAILWDAHHTFVQSKEEPEATVRQLGRYIRHTHLKDSVPAGNGRRYVLTGTGEVPVGRQIASLVKSGYSGLYSFEWEKRWHPEIEEPEVAFVQFAEMATRYLRDAGIAESPR